MIFAWTERKGKEEYLYSAILADTTLTKRSYMTHRHTQTYGSTGLKAIL